MPYIKLRVTWLLAVYILQFVSLLHWNSQHSSCQCIYLLLSFGWLMLTPVTKLCLCQVIEISEYRTQLYDYLKNRMMAIAPNLTVMVGELVGARLIAHAGGLQ